MFKNVTIGQFYPGNSFVHRLDPRVKLFAVFIFIVSLFFIKNLWLYLPIVGFMIVVIGNSRIPFKYVLKGLRPLLFILILTAVINLLMTPGRRIWQYWIFSITEEGIYQAAFMTLRLTFLMVGSSLLTLTTSPMRLTDGMEAAFKPLSKIGFPAHELAMMMTIALRFIPTLFEETDKIMKAQMARGADFESGNLLRRAKNLVPLLVPLFLNSLKRAEDLAVAMEARCYQGGDQRTRLNELAYRWTDYVTYVGLILFFGAIIVSFYI